MTKMTETEQRFREVLAGQLAEEPAPPPMSHVLARCARDRRRHRAGVLSAVCVVAVVGAGSAAATVARAHPDADRTTTADRTRSDGGIRDACRHGNQGPLATEAMFAPGPPRIEAQAEVAQTTRAVLVSADERYWADCFINHYPGAEFAAGMTVYEAAGTSTGVSYQSGTTCVDLDGPPSPPCPTFEVTYVDRLPHPVASVVFETLDGLRTQVPTRDGFVLFTHVAEVPPGVPRTDPPLSEPSRVPQWLERVTYLDARGDPIAAQDLGTSDSAEMAVGDLPLLSAYPSLRDSEVGTDGDAHRDLDDRQRQLASDAITDSDVVGGHRLTRAFAALVPGTVTGQESNTGRECTSGDLIDVTVVGYFADIPRGGPPGDAGPTTAVQLTVDAGSGETCLVGVRTDEAITPRDSTPLPLDPEQQRS